MKNLIKRIFGQRIEEPKNSIKNQEIDLEEELKKVIEILDKHKRTAYMPIVSEVKSDFSVKSKIGGLPYLRNQNDWPVCPNCKKNMQLFLQLNLEDLPVNKDIGLIQLFYCTTLEPNCESDLEAFFPFSKAVECRKINFENNSAIITPIIDEIFDEKTIIDWKAKIDYPHPEEYFNLGIDLDLSDELYELMEERGIGETIQEDKLFGWPYWVQSEEYPCDRETGSTMKLLFQLTSENNLKYMFGDSGIGHLTQSIDNKNELGFGWACS